MAINMATKYSPKVSERYSLKSITDKYTGHEYKFIGEKTIKVPSVACGPFQDYKRDGTDRFGELHDLPDTAQEFTVNGDKGGTFSIDKGYQTEQQFIKKINKCVKRTWDEKVTPYIDKYRFKAWVNGAGISAVPSSLTKSNIIENIMQSGNAQFNRLVPETNLTLFIGTTLFTTLKLSDQIIGLEKLGIKAISRGHIGEIDVYNVVRVPDSWLPKGVNYIIKRTDATIDPMTLKTMNIHRSPRGVDGDVGEYRVIFDSFVEGNRADGVFVSAKSDAICAVPTISVSSGNATISSTTTGTTIYYTDDGSNPKTSTSRKAYPGSAVATNANNPIRAYALKSGLLNSGVAIEGEE